MGKIKMVVEVEVVDPDVFTEEYGEPMGLSLVASKLCSDVYVGLTYGTVYSRAFRRGPDDYAVTVTSEVTA